MDQPVEPEPRPPDGHGAIPEDHPILVDLLRAGEIVRRINERPPIKNHEVGGPGWSIVDLD